MKKNSVQFENDLEFDLFQVSQGKTEVKLSPHVLRKYHKQGLPFYRHGKFVFVSKRELQEFLRSAETATQEGAIQ
jgi:hypothetical protein